MRTASTLRVTRRTLNPISDADSHALSHFDTPPPYPLSCPPHPQNRACFPIWEPKNKAPAFREAESQALLDEPKIKFRSAKPHLSPRPEQRVTHDTRGPWGTTGYQARSILMTWPKGVSHAILYTDLACKHVGSGLAEEAWHVRKTGRQSKQFESLRAGMFGSVEFLTHKEWKLRAWKRRGAEIVKGLEV